MHEKYKVIKLLWVMASVSAGPSEAACTCHHHCARAMDGKTHEVAHAETVHSLLPVPAVTDVSSGLVHNPCR